MEKLQFSLAGNAARTEECLCTYPYVAALASGLHGLGENAVTQDAAVPTPAAAGVVNGDGVAASITHSRLFAPRPQELARGAVCSLDRRPRALERSWEAREARG